MEESCDADDIGLDPMLSARHGEVCLLGGVRGIDSGNEMLLSASQLEGEFYGVTIESIAGQGRTLTHHDHENSGWHFCPPVILNIPQLVTHTSTSSTPSQSDFVSCQ